MYFKMLVRSLWRHQKRGRRLFVLLALCCAALVVLFTFQADFDRQYRDLFIGMKTGHLQILPSKAAAFATNTFGAQDQDVPLLRVTQTLDRWVRSQPEVDEAAPVVVRTGLAYNLDSEYESWVSLVAVPADRRARLFPLAQVLSGTSDLGWFPGQTEVPVLHARLQGEFGQRNPDTGAFFRKELKARNAAQLEGFKARLQGLFPAIFGDQVIQGADHDQDFLDLWSASLPDPLLYKTIPPSRLEPYDYRVDDAIVALQENRSDALVTFLNKRLFQALFPDDIFFLPEPIVAGKSVTLQVPGLRSEGALALPKVIPARYVGMVDIMPLYMPDSYLDLDAFRHYLDAPEGAATGYVIRLKDTSATPLFRTKVEAWLKDHAAAEGLGDVRVTDYVFLGKLYLTTAGAFSVVIGILIGVFVLILVIFIVNLVLMSMIQRRREMGTGIALGLTSAQTVALMTGEVGVIVTVSWVAGSVLGLGLIVVAATWGIPGMIFFPGMRLYLTHQAGPYLWSYLLLLPSALLAAFIPLSGLGKLWPVDFFREAR